MKEINNELSAASEAGDVERITALGLEYTDTDKRLRELFAEWENLSSALEETGTE